MFEGEGRAVSAKHDSGLDKQMDSDLASEGGEA